MKWIIVIGLMIFGAGSVLGAGTDIPVLMMVKETDKGNEPYSKGKVIFSSRNGKVSKVNEDVCLRPTLLKEYYLQEGKKLRFDLIPCTCVEGVCIKTKGAPVKKVPAKLPKPGVPTTPNAKGLKKKL